MPQDDFAEQYKDELIVLKFLFLLFFIFFVLRFLNQSGITGLQTRDKCQCFAAKDF